jgi:hypothetical protein
MLKPGKWYCFSGWVRTRGIKAHGAAWYGTFAICRGGTSDAIAVGKNHGGDTEWTRTSIRFQAPEGGQIRIHMIFVAWGRGTGTAWFDRLKLVEVDQPRDSNAGAERKLSDAAVAKLLVGKWRFEPGPKDPPIKMTITFTKGRACAIEAESLQVKHKVKAKGTWKVKKGEIVTTFKENTNGREASRVGQSKVISIDESTLKITGTLTANPGAAVNKVKDLVFVFKKVK